jgi:hypothetical protein
MVDPLASQFPHNSVYALQENKFGLGVELEGRELSGFDVANWLVQGYVKYVQGGVDYAKNEARHNTSNAYTQNRGQLHISGKRTTETL